MPLCRWCSADIFFAVTLANGTRIPLNAVTPPGVANNITLPGSIDGMPMARVVESGTGTHTTHFATCPRASQFRRKKPRRRA